jgi:hypothetical protein
MAMTSFKGLDLWNAVEAVDKSYTKPITGREFSGNSVNLTYTTRKLTEALGPAGDRWGWEVMDEKVHEYGGEGQKNFVAIHSVRVRLWFRRDDGTFGHIEDYGTTKLAYYAGKGADRYLKVDEEAPKKSISDAKSKLFVALGGSAQLWLGEFDRSQHKYIDRDDDDRAARVPRQPARPASDRQRDESTAQTPLPPRAGMTAESIDVGEHTFSFGKERLTGPEWLDRVSKKAKDPDTDPKALQAWWESPRQVAERARFHKLKPELNRHLAAVKDEVLARFEVITSASVTSINPEQAMRAG